MMIMIIGIKTTCQKQYTNKISFIVVTPTACCRQGVVKMRGGIGLGSKGKRQTTKLGAWVVLEIVPQKPEILLNQLIFKILAKHIHSPYLIHAKNAILINIYMCVFRVFIHILLPCLSLNPKYPSF